VEGNTPIGDNARQVSVVEGMWRALTSPDLFGLPLLSHMQS
jgi:hypothetical protein